MIWDVALDPWRRTCSWGLNLLMKVRVEAKVVRVGAKGFIPQQQQQQPKVSLQAQQQLAQGISEHVADHEVKDRE